MEILRYSIELQETYEKGLTEYRIKIKAGRNYKEEKKISHKQYVKLKNIFEDIEYMLES